MFQLQCFRIIATVPSMQTRIGSVKRKGIETVIMSVRPVRLVRGSEIVSAENEIESVRRRQRILKGNGLRSR
jgi:hypothetical protein